MFPKVLFAIVATACIGAGLLALRQQRLSMKNQMARLHQQMDQTRRQTWDLQTKIAQDASPEALRKAIERAGLDLEPLAPQDISSSAERSSYPRRITGHARYVDGAPR